MCVNESGGILTHVFLSKHCFPRYLESNGWIVEDALRAAMEDGEWEKDLIETRNSNDIEIKVKTHVIHILGSHSLGSDCRHTIRI